jgi:hypothetical protein
MAFAKMGSEVPKARDKSEIVSGCKQLATESDIRRPAIFCSNTRSEIAIVMSVWIPHPRIPELSHDSPASNS